jgi:hypothetical protein
MGALFKLSVLILGILLTILSEARAVPEWRQYSGDRIVFFYPSYLYNTPKNETISGDQKSEDFEVISMKKNHGDGIDSVTVCQGNLYKCASRRDLDMPYWLEEDTGRLIIFNPTEKLVSYKNNFGTGYEAFPACEWTDSRGTSSQYGGQCYVAVISDGTKTLSFRFFLGPNVGISQLQKTYKWQLKNYRRTVGSAK